MSAMSALSPLEGLDLAAGLVRALLTRHLIAVSARADGPPTRATTGAAEVARILVAGGAPADPARALAELEPVVAEAWQRLRGRLEADPQTPLARLVRIFGLDDVELAVVAVLAAIEHDPDVDRACGFAWGEPVRRRPDLGALAQLLAGVDVVRRDRAVEAFAADRPLRRHRLVQLITGDLPLVLRPVRLADRVVAFLRGRDPLDEALQPWCQVAAAPALAELVVPAGVVAALERALAGRGDRPARILLHGPDGTGKATVATAALAARGAGALRADLEELALDGDRVADRLALLGREAALRGAGIILEHPGAIDPRAGHHLAAAIADWLAGVRAPVVIACARHPGWLASQLDDLVELEVPAPTYAERVTLWERALAGAAVEDDAAIGLIAGRYGFGAAAIRRAARRAVDAAWLRDPAAARVRLDELGSAARLTFGHRLGSVAERIPAGFRWEDLVVTDETREQIREVVRFARMRPFLLESWGFARKLPYGRGVSAILAGPPGTGKTMVAQLLAGDLGYDLYRIDLSQIVNKYIGETEKNLARIFEEAEDSHAVLFFDEADALFARRTEVKSSNDRYANLEVNYLLQRMETFDGVTLLATNLEQGIDDAFKRRVRFVLQFELPDVEQREALWKSMFPPEAPLAEGIGWTELAKRFEMSGGYIKKAAVRAAVGAAEARRPITHEDVLGAAQQEYREMGRLAGG